MKLAEQMGLKIERRPVELSELGTFDEVGACGTAAVISPINKITDDETGIDYSFGDKPGEISTKLYNKLLAIQSGDDEDVFGWVDIVE